MARCKALVKQLKARKEKEEPAPAPVRPRAKAQSPPPSHTRPLTRSRSRYHGQPHGMFSADDFTMWWPVRKNLLSDLGWESLWDRAVIAAITLHQKMKHGSNSEAHTQLLFQHRSSWTVAIQSNAASDEVWHPRFQHLPEN